MKGAKKSQSNEVPKKATQDLKKKQKEEKLTEYNGGIFKLKQRFRETFR